MLKNFFKNLCKNFKKKLAFSPVELMVTLVAVSVIAGSMTPVVTKQMSSQKQVAINPNQVTTQCSALDEDGYCTHCTESKCLECTRPCPDHARLNVEHCKCEACSTAFDHCNTCDDNKCTKCNPGFYLARNALGSRLSCVECPKGHYCDGLNKFVCPEGTYADTTKWHECKPCPPGKYQSNSSSNSDIKNHYKCGECPKGKYCPEWRSTVGKQCPSGTYQDQTGQIVCKPCDPGTASNEEGRTSSCPQCEAGSVARSEGQTSCALVNPGHEAPNKGMSESQKCDNGYATPIWGTVNCPACGVGQVAGYGQGSCQQCAPGFYKYNATTCVRCQAGKWTDGPADSCTSACPAGSYCPGVANCNYKGSTFDSRKENAAKVDATDSCGANKPEKKPCPPGHYCPAGSSEPTACPVNTYRASYGGKSVSDCAACGDGKVALAGSSKCEQCPKSHYVGSDGKCKICPKGNYCDGNVKTPCACGTYQDLTGQTSCKSNLVNTYSPTNGTGNTTYKSCATGQWTKGASGQCTCSNCIQGYKCGAEPNACEPGYYRPETSHTYTSCLACDAGYHQPQYGKGSCSCCPKGQYQNSTAQAGCKACPAGKKCPSTCMTVGTCCPAGYYQDETGKSECKICPPGHKCPSTCMTAPTKCEPSTYQDLEGQTDCKSCEKGRICPDYAMTRGECCPKGSYQDETGKTSCKTCRAGRKCPNTCMTADECCSTGSYQDETGKTSCKTCRAGHKCPNTCMTADTCCDAGTYQPNGGQTSCTTCSKGHKCPGTCRTTQEACTAPEYQPNTGKTSCECCPAGKYCATNGLSSPTGTCSAGTISSSCSKSCTSCDSKNSCQPSTGQSSCKAGNIEHCTKYNTSTCACTECEGLYTLIDGKCSAACTADECDVCYEGEPDRCFVCRTGYVPEAQSGKDKNGNYEEWIPTGNCVNHHRCSSYIWYCNKCFLGANAVSGVSFYQCYECGCGYRPVFLRPKARGETDYNFGLQACTNCDLKHNSGEQCNSGWCNNKYYYCDDKYEKLVVMSPTCEKHDGPYTWSFTYKGKAPDNTAVDNTVYSRPNVGPPWKVIDGKDNTETGFYTQQQGEKYYSAPTGTCDYDKYSWPGESSASYNKAYCTPKGLYNKTF